MILLSFKESPETRGEHYPCSAFRWVLEYGRNFVGLFHQAQDKKSGEWDSSHSRAWAVYIEKVWRFGPTHFWYDGPHCMFYFGPVIIQWNNPECKKCSGE